MTRGNQRELARAKNAKKEATKKGANAKSGSELAKQGLSDAEKMRQKQMDADKKRAEKEAEALKAKVEAKIKK
ncbi:uncharacterized protein TrAtP1_010164 [Trichoderma atroviride]|uniref:uncharacterized protein n=1 Tax=Hypocrea atroviridis TaxID=63577 RepID=UPI003328D6C2|nr:hypothetical protein TrAtP1_010164 [Trichoderma atroviride]